MFFRMLVRSLVLLGLIVTSCQNPPKPEDLSRTVRLNLRYEPLTLDPRKGGDVISSHMHFLLFEGLVTLHHDRSILPAQAESFAVSEDKKVYTFFLRDTKWSDGSAVTAKDFELAWKQVLNPTFPSQCPNLFYSIKNAEAAKQGKISLDEVGIVAKDAKTLEITLEKPTPYFLDLVSFCVFSPVSSAQDQAMADWACHAGSSFVCNGPFLLKSWKHDDEMVLVKNPLYWNQKRTLPDEIHFSMIGNETTALQLFENGELDMIGDPLSPLPVDALPALKEKGSLRHYAIAGTTMTVFNVNCLTFSNPKIRKAFSYAIDRQALVDNITQMHEYPATSIVPPIFTDHQNRSFFKDHDVAQAQLLFEEGMQEAGLTREDFNQLVYIHNTNDVNHKIAQALQQQWYQALGVKVQLTGLDQKVLVDQLKNGNYHFGLTRWMAQYNDPMSVLERFKIKENAVNFPHWEHPEFAQLLDRSYEEEAEVRSETLTRAEQIFLEEMPICPIYHWQMTYLVQPTIQGVGITPIGALDFETLQKMR